MSRILFFFVIPIAILRGAPNSPTHCTEISIGKLQRMQFHYKIHLFQYSIPESQYRSVETFNYALLDPSDFKLSKF